MINKINYNISVFYLRLSIYFYFYVNIFINHVIKKSFEVEFILSYDFIILNN